MKGAGNKAGKGTEPMRVYIYQSALLCEDCGDAKRAALDPNRPAHIDPDNESSYDSGEYPKGPYGDGGGEADSPQHCDHCGVFLQNPLTDDGREYVRERVEAEGPRRIAGRQTVACRVWAPFYGIGA